MKKSKFKDGSFLTNTLIGTAVSYAIILVMLFITACLISKEKIGEGTGEWIIMIASYLGVFIGACVARKLNKSMLFKISIATAILVIFLKLIISASSLKGNLFDSGDMRVIACFLAGGLTAGLMRERKKKRRH